MDFNDIGYLKTADIIMMQSRAGYVINRPFWLIRDFSSHAEQYNQWNFGRERLVSGVSGNVQVQFINEYGCNVTFSRETEHLDTRLLRGGPAFILPSIWSGVYSINTNRQKDLSFFLTGRNDWFDDPYSRYYRIAPGFRLHIHEAFNVQNTFAYTFNRDDLQYIGAYNSGEAKQYLLARIDQKTLSTTFRLNYCISPELSMQYYGQPFISAGRFSAIRKAAEPRSGEYDRRFYSFAESEIAKDTESGTYVIDENRDGTPDHVLRNPDFNVRHFRSNFVIRWEYAPGSTFYLVWSQNRSGEIPDGRFRFRNDLNGLFNIYPHNVFMVKWSHWFSA